MSKKILLGITIFNTCILIVFVFAKNNIKETIEIIGTGVTAVLAFLVYKAQTQKDSFEYRLQRPHLNFVNTGQHGWVILNVGNGPGLNIRFMEKAEDWERPIIGYSIPPNVALKIMPELKAAAALVVVYTDSFDKEYMVQCSGDTNSVVLGKGDKNWDEELYKKLHTNVRRSNILHLISI
jgi:hypothetical protein